MQKRFVHFALLVFIMLGFFSLTISATVPIRQSTSTDVVWSGLHGVQYKWGPLTGDSNIDSVSPRPSVSFPMIKSLGFNIVSVYFRWQIYLNNPSLYLGYLEMIASAADSSGLNVVYSLEIDDMPTCLIGSYSGNPALWGNALLTNGATNCAQAIWTMNENLWKAVIAQFDSHSSTLGYGIIQEPWIANCDSSTLATYNTHFAQYIRTLTSKAIVWMGPYTISGSGGAGGPCSNLISGDEASAPSGSVGNLVFSGHDYDRGGQISSYASIASRTNSQLWIGEWAICNGGCSSLSQAQIQSVVSNYDSLFNQYNAGESYWAWQEANPVNTESFQNLLDANGNEWWLDGILSQTYSTTTILNSSLSTSLPVNTSSHSFSTTSPSVSSSSIGESTTTSSSINSSSTSYTSSSSISTSPISTSTTKAYTNSSIYSSSSLTSTSSESSSSITSTQNSTSTSLSTYSSSDSLTMRSSVSFEKSSASFSSSFSSQFGRVENVGSPSSTSNASVLAYSFAGYEIVLLCGLPVIVKAVGRVGRKDDYGWRW